MLGQHPQAYGLPEVNLSHGDTLGDMWDSVIIAGNFGTAGLLRLLTEIAEGQPEKEIADRAEAHDFDLLVMGAYGHSRIRSLLIGSTTTEMIRACKVPVLLFR